MDMIFIYSRIDCMGLIYGVCYRYTVRINRAQCVFLYLENVANLKKIV